MNILEESRQFILKTFSNSIITRIEFQPEGLTSNVFVINLENPKQKIILKEFASKKRSEIEKDIKIQQLLLLKGFQIPKVLATDFNNSLGIILIEKIPGEVGTKLFHEADRKGRSKIMFSAGANLLKIHKLYKPDAIPPIWQISKVTITSSQDWVNWTKLRTEKYLKFCADNLTPDICKIITKSFQFLNAELSASAPVIMPLHWDYHLGNLLYNKNTEVFATLDFATAMPGDPLADLGQALYWQIIKFGNRDHFSDLLLGYAANFSSKEFQLIEAYYLLHLIAVLRNTWHLEKLKWLTDKHLGMLNNYHFFKG